MKKHKLVIFTTIFFILNIYFIIAKTRKSPFHNMIYIPAGTFIFGTDQKDKSGIGKEFGTREGKFFENAKPSQKIYLDGYYIDKYEVTIKEYRKFIKDTDRKPPKGWKNVTDHKDRDLHPVVSVTWFDAFFYCSWTGKRLPTEQEWEKAARGPNGNIYPWGNEFSENKANLTKGDTFPVGSKPYDKSFYGVLDMAGNVIEWTDSWYKPYPGSNYLSNFFGEKFKVARGATGNIAGHYQSKNSIYNSQSSFRQFYKATDYGVDVGFRCVKYEK